MRIKLLLVLLTVFCCRIKAQDKLPAFRLVDANGSYVRNSALPANRSVILIYFQPDCEDCREFTTLLMKDDVIVRRHEIVMITNSDLEKMKQFVADFNLQRKRNVIVGTESWTGTVQRKLNITRFPTVTAYDQRKVFQWQLINNGGISQMYDQLKRLSSQRQKDHRKTLP